MAELTKAAIMHMIEEDDYRFIRLHFTDMFGMLKNIAINSKQLPAVLEEQYLFDTFSIGGFAQLTESEMLLRPNINTFAVLPWRPQQGKVARFICDVLNLDGTPFELDPRYILKKTLEQAKAMGFDILIKSECQFFLFMLDENGLPSLKPSDMAQYLDVAPLDQGENARRDISFSLDEMGFEVEGSHHEKACGQHEVEFKRAEALTAADNISTLRLVVKSIAKRHGLHATFMPKPLENECGSGMFVSLSLLKDGKDTLSVNDGQLDSVSASFIAGLMAHASEMCLVTNPLVNSYKRLKGHFCPSYNIWSFKHNNPMVRVTAEARHKSHIKFRLADSAANPYLALALIIAAGMDGVKRGLIPVPSTDELMDAADASVREEAGLPTNLGEAITAFKDSEFAKGVLGDLHGRYLEAKCREWDEYQGKVHSWEITKYFNLY